MEEGELKSLGIEGPRGAQLKSCSLIMDRVSISPVRKAAQHLPFPEKVCEVSPEPLVFLKPDLSDVDLVLWGCECG